MKTLIVYYSFTHNNEQLAKALQEKLGCDLFRIEETRKRTGFTILLDIAFRRTPRIKPHQHHVSSYDHCIFVAPVWAGKVASPLRAFILQEKYRINRYSFITLCGGSAGQKEKLAAELNLLMEHPPELVEELWINDLLPEEKKNRVKYTSGHRIDTSDLGTFEARIDDFLRRLKASYRIKQVVG